MEKIYFKLRGLSPKWFPITLIGLLFVAYLPMVNEENALFYFSVLVFASCTSILAAFGASSYGFKVGNNKLILRTPEKVRRYKLYEVEKVVVTFIK